MSISKEERERYRSWLPTMPMFEAEVLEGLLDALDATDEQIAELANELKAKQNKVNQRSGQLKEARQQIADLQRENEQLRDKLTSTDAERRFWENEAAMVADSLVNPDEEDDADDEDVL